MQPGGSRRQTLEEGFLRAMCEDPADDSHALLLADWLEEQGDARAELVRVHRTLRRATEEPRRQALEARLQTLLAAGVRPCVPLLVNSVGMMLAWIPPGSFLMGSPVTEGSRDPDEGPLHAVTITRPFWLGVFPVTQDQFHRVMDTPLAPQEEFAACPAEGVSRDDATEFCRRLSERSEEKKSRRRYSLPTEAEWEYACRADTRSPYHFGDSLSPTQANFDGRPPVEVADDGDFRGQATASGTFPANAFGLYDMHGNVWEWCQDGYGHGYYEISPPENPQGPEEHFAHVLRGGSWADSHHYCRSAYRRSGGTPYSRHNDKRIGFRVACTVARLRRRTREGR